MEDWVGTMNENRQVRNASDEETSLTSELCAVIAGEIVHAGGWIGFGRFMQMALYQPGLGYYANESRKFGAMPSSGSDFVTAPQMSPLFGRCLAAQVAQAMAQSGVQEIWEFGAGSGALARQLLLGLGDQVQRYVMVELSGTLRQRQREHLADFASKVEWVGSLPERIEAVVLGNEVLDAMPVTLLARVHGEWHERGVTLGSNTGVDNGAAAASRSKPPGAKMFAWSDRPTALRPPAQIEGGQDYLTEIHPQAEAFMRTLAERLKRGAAFFIDYGFPEHEYYHPQRAQGTLMCHQGHRLDADPLADVGLKDITAHVNFSAMALAAQDAGLDCLGYCGQGRFLLNCGIAPMLQEATLAERTHALRLVHEHEMGELFKVIGFVPSAENGLMHWQALGFCQGERSHTL